MKRHLMLHWTIFLILFFLGVLSACARNIGSENGDINPVSDSETEPLIDVVINKIDATCLSAGAINILLYASAINENGELIDSLTLPNFQITLNSIEIPSQNIYFSLIKNILLEHVSIAILMDYSTSITESPETRTAMENAVVSFINLMQPDDQAEILKFNNCIRYVQPFTNDKSALIAAVENGGVEPGSTYLYDSLYYSLEDTAEQEGRKAVVALTDGEELHEPGLPGDGRTMQDVVSLARKSNISLFLIGLGQEVDEDILQQMADQTGGHFYQAAAINELESIYSSISDLIGKGQYLFEFESPWSAQSSGNLAIMVTYGDLTDDSSSTFVYPVCPI